MNPRQLRYFLAVVDNSGVNRAAAALHVAQPSVSQAIRQLEVDLHVPLFDRVGRRVVLSEAGRALVGPARRALQDMRSAEEAVAAIRGLEYGRVRLIALPALCVDPLPDLIARFCHNHPALTVTVDVGFDAQQVLTAVQDGESDVGFLNDPDLGRVKGLSLHQVGTTEIKLAFPPDESVRPSRPMPLTALKGREFIAGAPGTRTRAILDEVLASGVDVRVVAEVVNRDMVVPLILRGVGCGLVASPYAAIAEEAGAHVVSLRPKTLMPTYVCYRSVPQSPAIAAFVAVATEVSGSLPSKSRRT